MRLPVLILACSFVSISTAAPPANVELVETFDGISQYRLKSNGMTLTVAPDRGSPVFTFLVVYHVGSRNEAPGNTGSAHLLEHMIFNKSTENFGKAKGHKTFQDVLYENGADYASSNMTTWYDRMTGYSTLPAGKLDLAMRIEADRMQRALLLDSERQSEMSVVRNEFEIGENDPLEVLDKEMVATVIQAHPYHWSTIGYRSDIEGVNIEKLREHYRTYFHPDNADAIVSGDFDVEDALKLFDREFGGFPRASRPIPKVVTVEPPQQGERRTVVKRPGSVGLVSIGYVRPGASDPDFVALQVLADILGNGVTSRLYQALVDQGLATAVRVENEAFRDPYPILLGATCAPGKSQAEVEAAMKAVVARVVAEGVSDAELKRAQQRIDVATVRSRDGPYAFAASMGEAVASADWKWFLTYGERIKAVTTDDVRRVAATYLVPDHATVGWFVPTANVASVATTPSTPTASVPTPIAAVDTKASPAQPRVVAKPFAERTLHRVLANGIVVDVIENHAVPTVAIRASVLAGNMTAPPGRPALPALVEKMVARGTTTRTKEEISTLLGDVGATRRYATTYADVSVLVDGRAQDTPLMIELMADELEHPAFTAAELAKARSDVENDVRRADDDTSQRAMERLGQRAFRPDHPYYPPGRAAKLASAAAVTESELRDFHRARYVGSGMIIAIAGDIDAAATMREIERRFADVPRGEPLALAAVARTEADAPVAREVVTMRGKANMNIVMGSASALRRTDPDYEAALVSNAVLGQSSLASRIGRRVRDAEGLSYALSSRYLQTDLVDGLWAVNVNVAPQNLARAMHSTRDELEKYRREGATDAEVAVQKTYFAGNYQVNLGSNGGVAAALVNAERFGLGPRYLDEFPARIRAVTTADANAAMRRHFFPDRLQVIVAGDIETMPD